MALFAKTETLRLTSRLQQAFFDVVHGRDPRYRHWLTLAPAPALSKP